MEPHFTVTSVIQTLIATFTLQECAVTLVRASLMATTRR